VVITAVVVTLSAGALQIQPLTVAAQGQTATLWGIDACDSAQSVVPATQTYMGNPQFMGRYLGSTRCGTPGLSALEASYLESLGVSVLLIADPDGFDDSSVQAESAQAAGEAQTAIQQAEALGAPAGTAIFRDVEINDAITPVYIQSWYQTFVASDSGYVPGFYDNSYNTEGAFAGATGAFCSAEQTEAAIGSGVVLWSDEFEPHYGDQSYSPTPSNAPAWDPSPAVGDPYPLPCANTTVAWQYEERRGFPSDSPDPDVDVDEFVSADANLLWRFGGAYDPLTPYRICDTRTGTGTDCSGTSSDNVIGAGGVLTLPVAGVTGPQGQSVPATAQAVVLNVTAINGTAGTYLTAYPAGFLPPTASNLNVPAQTNQANLVVVALGTGGEVSIYNSLGSINVAVDVQGYFAAASPASPSGPPVHPISPLASPSGLFHPIPPLRMCDTREGTGTACSGSTADNLLGAGQWTRVVVSGLPSGAGAGTPSVPSNGTALAVALNLTAVSGTVPTYLSVVPPRSGDACPTGTPAFSNLNVGAGVNLPNRVMVPLGPDQDVCVYNSQGSTNFILDVNGWFGDGGETSQGALFYVMQPTRICDTRAGTGTECSGNAIGPAQSLTVPVAGVDGIPSAGNDHPPVAVIANVTAVGGSQGTYFTLYPSDVSRPNASDVNAGPQQNTANLSIVQLATTGGSAGDIDLYNAQGTTDALMDVAGWFQA
jgi:hypothetical protein